MFDWTNYSNLTRLQINVDTILFFSLIHSLIKPTLWLVWQVHMHNSLTDRSHSPSNPQEEFLLKNTQVKRPFRIVYELQVYPFYTTQHNNTTSPKIERKSDLIKLHFNLVPRSLQRTFEQFWYFLPIKISDWKECHKMPIK